MADVAAKKITVHTVELNPEGDEHGKRTESAYLLPNGAVMVPGETCNDWFFGSIEEYEPCGSSIVKEVEVSEEVSRFDLKTLRQSVIGSAREFGEDSIPQSVIELVGIRA